MMLIKIFYLAIVGVAPLQRVVTPSSWKKNY